MRLTTPMCDRSPSRTSAARPGLSVTHAAALRSSCTAIVHRMLPLGLWNDIPPAKATPGVSARRRRTVSATRALMRPHAYRWPARPALLARGVSPLRKLGALVEGQRHGQTPAGVYRLLEGG